MVKINKKHYTNSYEDYVLDNGFSDYFVSVKNASKFTGLHVNTIYNMINDGRLATNRFGKSYFINIFDILPFSKKHDIDKEDFEAIKLYDNATKDAVSKLELDCKKLIEYIKEQEFYNEQSYYREFVIDELSDAIFSLTMKHETIKSLERTLEKKKQNLLTKCNLECIFKCEDVDIE